MTKVLNRIFENIVKINIEGTLKTSTQANIFRLLKEIQPYRLKALFITINSFGGSLPVAKNIATGLIQFSQQKKIPVYCFAEQFCLNSANVVLSAGTKSFASKFSILGDFGYIYQEFDFSQFSKKYNVSMKFIKNTEMKIQPSFLGHTRFTNQQQIRSILNNAQKHLINQVANNRTKKIQQNGYTQDQFKNRVLQVGIIDPFDAQKIGLIDDVKNVENQLYRNFKGVRIVEPQRAIISEFLKRSYKRIIPFYK